MRLVLRLPGLTKTLRFETGGALSVSFAWDDHPASGPALFTSELSLAGPVSLDAHGATVWRYPIETVAKSENGLERTVQGEAVVVGWGAELGRGELTVSGER